MNWVDWCWCVNWEYLCISWAQREFSFCFFCIFIEILKWLCIWNNIIHIKVNILWVRRRSIILTLESFQKCSLREAHKYFSSFFFSPIQFHLISTGLVDLVILHLPQALEGMLEMSYSTIPSLYIVRRMQSPLQHSPGTKMDSWWRPMTKFWSCQVRSKRKLKEREGTSQRMTFY